MSQETIERSFHVAGAAVVRVDNINGSVTIRPGPAGEIHVHAVMHRKDSLTQIEIDQDETGAVHARTRIPAETGLLRRGLHNPSAVDFTVTVPAEVRLTVKAVNSRTDVQGVHGSLELHSVNGAIDVADVSGELEFHTVNGAVSGSRVAGRLAAKSVNGKLCLADSDIVSMDGSTVNGGIELDSPLGEGPYRLQSVSGNVRLKLPDAPSGRIEFKSVSGRARFNHDRLRAAGEGAHRPGRRTFELGPGGPEIRFKSVSGNLDLFSTAEQPGLQGGTVPAPAANPDVMGVLERISKGELTVDDGLAALQQR